METAKQYCTFWLEDLFFGVRVDKVKEVMRYQDMTYVPHAPREIVGLINLRGDIVTAIDMRRRLWLKEYTGEKRQKNVIIRDPGGALSLIVDEIGDVVETEDRFFESPPMTMDSKVRDIVVGVYKMKTNLLLILNVEKLIYLDKNDHLANSLTRQ